MYFKHGLLLLFPVAGHSGPGRPGPDFGALHDGGRRERGADPASVPGLCANRRAQCARHPMRAKIIYQIKFRSDNIARDVNHTVTGPIISPEIPDIPGFQKLRQSSRQNRRSIFQGEDGPGDANGKSAVMEDLRAVMRSMAALTIVSGLTALHSGPPRSITGIPTVLASLRA